MLALLATQVNASVVYLSCHGILVCIIFGMILMSKCPLKINELLNKITSYINYFSNIIFPEAAIQPSSYLFLQKSSPPLPPTISPLTTYSPPPQYASATSFQDFKEILKNDFVGMMDACMKIKHVNAYGSNNQGILGHPHAHQSRHLHR